MKSLIIHEQDVLDTGNHQISIFILGHPFGFDGREKGTEDGSPSRRAFNGQGSAMTFDDAVNHGKSHTGTVAFPFGAEKRIKNAFDYLRRHTMSRVAYGESYKFSGNQPGMVFDEISIDIHVRKAHLQQSAAFLHGMARIGTQIHNDLMNIGGVRHYCPIGRYIVVNLDC